MSFVFQIHNYLCSGDGQFGDGESDLSGSAFPERLSRGASLEAVRTV